MLYVHITQSAAVIQFLSKIEQLSIHPLCPIIIVRIGYRMKNNIINYNIVNFIATNKILLFFMHYLFIKH